MKKILILSLSLFMSCAQINVFKGRSSFENGIKVGDSSSSLVKNFGEPKFKVELDKSTPENFKIYVA